MAIDADAATNELISTGADDAAQPPGGDEVSTDTDTDTDTEAGAASATESAEPRRRRAWIPTSPPRQALLVGLIAVVAVSGVAGWLGNRAWQSHQAQQLTNLYLAVGQQGAIDLTTLDYKKAEADVQRIIDASINPFREEFQQRAQPFIEVIKEAQSKSTGTITAAGVESEQGDQAQVLVAITVKTSDATGAEQPPKSWRMRIGVHRTSDGAKVSHVEFVP
jgi:Mce-associated membrane protein